MQRLNTVGENVQYRPLSSGRLKKLVMAMVNGQPIPANISGGQMKYILEVADRYRCKRAFFAMRKPSDLGLIQGHKLTVLGDLFVAKNTPYITPARLILDKPLHTLVNHFPTKDKGLGLFEEIMPLWKDKNYGRVLDLLEVVLPESEEDEVPQEDEEAELSVLTTDTPLRDRISIARNNLEAYKADPMKLWDEVVNPILDFASNEVFGDNRDYVEIEDDKNSFQQEYPLTFEKEQSLEVIETANSIKRIYGPEHIELAMEEFDPRVEALFKEKRGKKKQEQTAEEPEEAASFSEDSCYY